MTTSKTKDMTSIALCVVLIAISAWIAIPAAVPFTLQTMGVFTVLGILGGRRGTIAILVYMVMGTIGIPVFSNFTGGIGVLFGSTGGYIIGFLFAALIMWGMEKLFGTGKIVLAISMLLGLLACYVIGTIWFMAVYAQTTGPVGVWTVLGWCVFPFVIPDLIKIAVAMFLKKRLKGQFREE